MNDLSTLGARIKYGLSKAGKKQADLAKYVGIKTATCSQWCSDKVKALKSDNALKVSRFLGVNYDWLVTGRGSPDAEDVVSLPDDIAASDGYVQIKEYTITCGAGSGCTPSYEEIENSIPATYRQSYFDHLGISPSVCKRFRVKGDSMEPILFNDDTILVDTSDNKRISNNSVYAINVGDEVRVKRLILQMNKDLIIRSENKAYPDEIIKHDDSNACFSIIGRVIEKSGKGGL